MRVLDHPNICSLRAYFYSQGDTKVRVIKKSKQCLSCQHLCTTVIAVRWCTFYLFIYSTLFFFWYYFHSSWGAYVEGRSLPQSRHEIHAGNSLSGISPLR